MLGTVGGLTVGTVPWAVGPINFCFFWIFVIRPPSSHLSSGHLSSVISHQQQFLHSFPQSARARARTLRQREH